MEIRALHEGIRKERVLIAAGLAAGAALGALLFGAAAWTRPSDRAQAPRSSAIEAASASIEIGPKSPTAALRKERDELERRVAELEVTRLKQRLARLEAEQTTAEPPAQAPQSAVVAARSNAAPATATGADPSGRGGERSLAYWNSLNDIMAREADMRKPPSQITAENAAGFIAARGSAGRYACDAIRQLDQTGVDEEIATVAREIATWYERGVSINERAGGLLGSADSARQGAPGQSWRNGEEQHRKQCEEINRKGAQLRTRMARKYKLPFPPLQ